MVGKATADVIREVVELANQLRGAFDEPLLEDLPAGRRSNAWQCPLARAFNFECKVAAKEVRFDSRHAHQARKLAELVGADVVVNTSTGESRVPLPNEFATLVANFDYGLLPSRYYDRTWIL